MIAIIAPPKNKNVTGIALKTDPTGVNDNPKNVLTDRKALSFGLLSIGDIDHLDTYPEKELGEIGDVDSGDQGSMCFGCWSSG
jgi:hypothetical protein